MDQNEFSVDDKKTEKSRRKGFFSAHMLEVRFSANTFSPYRRRSRDEDYAVPKRAFAVVAAQSGIRVFADPRQPVIQTYKSPKLPLSFRLQTPLQMSRRPIPPHGFEAPRLPR